MSAGGPTSAIALKTVLKRLWRLTPFGLIQDYERRLRALEERIYNRRWAAIEEIGDYLVGAQIPGDYCEFGVFAGNTFGYAVDRMSVNASLAHMRFFAFDSFQGLPEPTGIDTAGNFASNFRAGEFACSEAQFLANLRRRRTNLDRVRTVPGWFSETLNDETADRLGLTSIAAAWIDGDLYESCVPVLAFLTKRITVGSLIAFDDWRVYRNLPDRGEQLACAEWLAANPQIKLREIFSFGQHGLAFTVAEC